MEIDEKLESLESEFKLMKVELKETLTNVRDFLLNVRPLPVERGTALEIDEEGQLPQPEASSLESVSDIPEPEAAGEPSEEGMSPEAEQHYSPAWQETETEAPSLEAAPFEKTSSLEEGGNVREEELCQSTPRVNLLVNLVHWVSDAKKEIGSERMSAFLDIYGISRRLPPGLKELILHLAETLEEPLAGGSSADVWRRLTLELHGILTGGVPFRALGAFGDEEKKGIQLSDNGGKETQQGETEATEADRTMIRQN